MLMRFYAIIRWQPGV